MRYTMMTLILLLCLSGYSCNGKPTNNNYEIVIKKSSPAPPPRDFYTMSVIKLTLKKAVVDSMSTKVQVKLTLVYKTMDQITSKELNQRKVQILDLVKSTISKMFYEEISSATYREEILKPKLIKAINKILSKGKVLDGYFDRFIIQRIKELPES